MSSFEVILPFLKPIAPLLESESISEIMVNPDASVWTEEAGQKSRIDACFDPGALEAALDVIANKFGRKLDANSPILNLRLPDGNRLAAVIPPVVHPRPLLTIRKFTAFHWRMADMVARKVLTVEDADQLRTRVLRGDNVLISGGTNCGKTTLLNVMADAIPEEERILLIEDTAELRIRKPHVVQMEAQVHTHKQAVTFDDLLKATLRHRPDRILVGEVRGPEARTLLDAMNTGHRGTLATIHANGAEAALRRLAMLAARGTGSYDRRDAESEVVSAIDAVVHLGRIEDQRYVQEILDCSRRGEE